MEQTAQTCAYQPGCKPSYATDLDGTMLTQRWPGCLTSVDLHVIAGAGWCCGCALTQCFSFSSNSDRSTLGAKSAGTLQSLVDWRLLCKRKARPKDIMADGKHWNVPVAADRPRMSEWAMSSNIASPVTSMILLAIFRFPSFVGYNVM